jgi:hypothetical protein
MKRLIPFIIAFFLCVTWQQAQAQGTMVIHATGGDRTFSIADIHRITFILDTILRVPTDGNRKRMLEAFKLLNGFPNPANSSITIPYEIATSGIVELRIFDTSGRLVTTLVSQRATPGSYRAVWDGTSLNGSKVTTGTYFCRLNHNGASTLNKIILLK